VRKLVVVPLLLVAAAAPAAAAAPLVPTTVQRAVRTKATALAYAPTRAPANYRYLSYGWDAGERQLTIRLHDRHYAVSNDRHTVAFTAERFGRPLAACAAGKTKTIQYDGNKVYWDGTTAWRCVAGPKGNVRLSATGPSLPDVALALVVSSGRRLA
jgi:hypothetical protein